MLRQILFCGILSLFCCTISAAPDKPAEITVKLASGDGNNKVFGPTFLFHRSDPQFKDQEVVKGTVSLTDGVTTFRDNGEDGTLIGGYGQGFIDYPSALYYVIFNNPPPAGSDITATFQLKPKKESSTTPASKK